MNTLSVSNRTPHSAANGRALTDTAFDQLLDQAFGGFGFTRGRSSLPTVEVQEAEKEYVVSVDLPGVALEDIDLRFSEGLLTVRAERKAVATGALYSDRWSGRFERVIGIDNDVDESQIRASHRNGVLTVTLPKKPERLPRRIEIQ
jgi:HSP20 family protein